MTLPMQVCRLTGLMLVVMAVWGADFASAQETKVRGSDAVALREAAAKSIAFLRSTQADDGSWTTAENPGITGLVLYGLLQNGLSPTDSMVAKGLKHLESFKQADGGVYHPQSSHKNYETSVVVLAFAAANGEGRYTDVIAKAKDFLKKLQWDDTEGLKPSDLNFGGAGYGKSQRPDLSNTAFLVEALKAAGVGKDDPAMKNAVVFLSRCQNLETESNTTPFATKVRDGGFYYTPAAGGTSMAGQNPDGGLRSYGSMTYTGLKSMIYAGVGPDDPRVKAAYTWVRKHYTVTENPGMGKQGVFYYYHTFAKALNALNVDLLEDDSMKTHDWRKELGDHLLAQQRKNGSWVNDEKRWFEGDPNLTTAYVLMTLPYIAPPAPKK